MAGPALLGMLLGLTLATAGVERTAEVDPNELVRRLGAPRFAEREAAAAALVKVGRRALPALFRARNDRDPEIRTRAEALAVRVEANSTLDATPVRLDIQDLTLDEAVAALGKASDMTLIAGNTMPAINNNRNRRLTLASEATLPFWNALDRLCMNGGLRRRYPMRTMAPIDTERPFELSLFPNDGRRPPTSDHGALRVELLRIRYDRRRDYEGTRPFGGTLPGQIMAPGLPPADLHSDPETGSMVGTEFRAELLVSAEPRLRIFFVGPVERPEAVDDQGRSLLVASAGAAMPPRDPVFPGFNPNMAVPGMAGGYRRSQATWPVTFPLSYHARPAQRIARLSGILPVAVLARRPEPIVADLKIAVGKTLSNASHRITVHDARAQADRMVTVEMTLEPTTVEGDVGLKVYRSDGGLDPINPPVDLMELRLDAIDDQGQRLEWSFARPPDQGNQGRMALSLRRRNNQPIKPAEVHLRYWDVTGASIDLPFSFADVESP